MSVETTVELEKKKTKITAEMEKLNAFCDQFENELDELGLSSNGIYKRYCKFLATGEGKFSPNFVAVRLSDKMALKENVCESIIQFANYRGVLPAENFVGGPRLEAASCLWQMYNRDYPEGNEHSRPPS